MMMASDVRVAINDELKRTSSEKQLEVEGVSGPSPEIELRRCMHSEHGAWYKMVI
jgi:hypothetical protein